MVASRKLPLSIPGLLLLEFIDYGRGTQLHIEKMVHLEKAYAYERGYLPALYEKKKKLDDYNEKVFPKLEEVREQIVIMRESYKSNFEGVSCNPQEEKFNGIMSGVFERLVYIAAYTGMIDTLNVEDVVDVVG